MQVLWWLVPPFAMTVLAMLWAGWAGRARDDVKRDDSEEALQRVARALAKPTPRRGTPVQAAIIEPTHGVAVRRTPRQSPPVEPPRT